MVSDVHNLTSLLRDLKSLDIQIALPYMEIYAWISMNINLF